MNFYCIPIFRISFLSIVFLLLMIGCSNNKMHDIYSNNESKQVSEKLGLNQLLKNPDLYNKKIIEVTGIYKTDFEESAIYASKISYWGKKTKKALWVVFNNEYYPLIDSKTGINLLDSYQTIEKINGKKIKIKGRFNASSKGHLSLYSGTIENVFYVEVMN